jgi:P4 family phage/plasmid primase-like protien
VEQKQFDKALDYLVQTLTKRFADERGASDERVRPRFKAYLIDEFEKAVYSTKSSKRYFLIDRSGEVMSFNGRFYERNADGENTLATLIKVAMHRLGIGLVYEKLVYREIAKQCIEGMKCDADSQFQPNRRYIVFTNCVLDLKSGNLCQFDLTYQSDVILDFAYQGTAKSPLWQSTLNRTLPNQDARRAFQMFCGALLADRSEYSIEHICYLVGNGRNGKSVIAGAVAGMLGAELVSNFSPQQLLTDPKRDYNCAALEGKIVNLCDDVKNTDFSGGSFKQLVSGQTFQARNPGGRPFKITPPLMLCCVNELPYSSDRSVGHMRRPLPLACPNEIPLSEVDTQLGHKLQQQKAAIFNWVYDGYRDFVHNRGKIAITDSMRQDLTKNNMMGNSVTRWLVDIEMITVSANDIQPQHWTRREELYKGYSKWCDDYNEYKYTGTRFGMTLTELGFIRRRVSGVTWYAVDYEHTDNYIDKSLPF